MKVDIYKSTKNGNKYLSVEEGTDVTKFPFPSTLDPDLHSLSPFKTSLDINEGDGRVALDSGDVINQITERGYATHGANVVVTVSTGS